MAGRAEFARVREGGLTVFRKTRMREPRQLGRARLALVRCQGEGHTAEEGD